MTVTRAVRNYSILSVREVAHNADSRSLSLSGLLPSGIPFSLTHREAFDLQAGGVRFELRTAPDHAVAMLVTADGDFVAAPAE